MPEALRTNPVATLFSFGKKVAACSAVLWFSAVALFNVAFDGFHSLALFLRIERFFDGLRKFLAAIVSITANIGENISHHIGNHNIHALLKITPDHSRNSISSCLSLRATLPIVLIPNWQANSARRNRCPMF